MTIPTSSPLSPSSNSTSPFTRPHNWRDAMLMTSYASSTALADVQPSEDASLSVFSDQPTDTFRPAGIAIGIAALALVIICFCIFVVVVVAKCQREQHRRLQITKMTAARRAHRQRLFPLSLPTLRSQPAVESLTDSQEHILAMPTHDASNSRAMEQELDRSDARMVCQGMADPVLPSLDIDLEALRMPLPPPPSYQEISADGPVRSVSESSWITEGNVLEETQPQRPRYGGRRNFRMKTSAARRAGTAIPATRRL
ncbi:uncharacterized protein PV09_09355 [Verruconis gallopava]|uniref:Uncharacterized protein n=1 Tax=Verruconis gallopava TaxID=253628 RepID=A0A0D1YDV3_9PEZI|nr:uncharacterized protein PV09_09355 [Verruconis gallopava]KIV98911.1 hypothetical protein PV09_09355 [Verruconis gallopava]